MFLFYLLNKGLGCNPKGVIKIKFKKCAPATFFKHGIMDGFNSEQEEYYNDIEL